MQREPVCRQEQRDTSLTVTEHATLRNNGTIILNGSFINNNGTVICADSSHVGGTATCSNKAVCFLCGQPYGSVAEEAHRWKDGVCSECGYECQHTFVWVTDKEATATEAGLKHEECMVCGYAKAAVEIPATTVPLAGDAGSMAQWVALLVVSAGGPGGMLLHSRRRRTTK